MAAVAVPAPASAPASCQTLIERELRSEGLPGTPELDAVRSTLLGIVKAEPVLFVSEPTARPTESKTISNMRALLRRSAHPADLVRQWLPLFRARPALGREVLLRDGYLYADAVGMARGLVEWVSLEHLSSAPQVHVRRGNELRMAERNGRTGRYAWASGPDQGQPVRLVLFDRIEESGGVSGPPLHRDLRTLRAELGFDSAQIVHLGASHIVAQLRYGAVLVPTLLASDGTRLQRQCESVDPQRQPELDEHRSEGLVRAAVVAKLRTTMVEQVLEALPFDEPRKEFGQQDGKLREAWERAYGRGLEQYRVHGDDYAVFDKQGRPAVPQVCLDFLVDTVERAGGKWWAGRDQPRARSDGAVDFASLGLRRLRSVPEFLAFARANPAWFEVLDVRPSEQIPFYRESEFLEHLAANPDDFRQGDLIFIRGFIPKPKDRKKLQHYHSFFVYETDPVTGMPSLIAGNAGRPRITTWLREMRRTPKRSVQHRVRVSAFWLAGLLGADIPMQPAPIAPGPDHG